MRLKSLLWRPLVGETLSAGPTELGGVAWTDGRSRVSRVAVSQDSGATWRDADLDTPESPYAWTEWSLTLTLAAGEPEVWVRAFDANLPGRNGTLAHSSMSSFKLNR